MTTFTTEDRLHAGETPLTNEQIDEILEELGLVFYQPQAYYPLARAIEEAHGIGE